MSNKRFSSILEELDYVAPKNRDLIIESRAHQVIASFAHLMKLIEESYDADIAADLQKRLINSLRTLNEEKFSRKIRAIRKDSDGDV
jgi:uncharacterized protein (UPF0305 family)